ncbi:hypothetical protein FRC17_009762 [Serendipita sp. 399]|nr:hypothetical protein FRC17_009762 [Serendipita sp. 399]
MSNWPHGHARHSSPIQGYGSTTSLPGHAASMGGDYETATYAPTEKAPDQTKPAQGVPFYKRRGFIICQIVTAIIGIIMLFLMLWPIVRAIAQHVLNVSHMNIESSVIESPENGTFTLKMGGYVTNTGIIPAVIHWTEPVRVSWMRDYGQDNETEVALGNMMLDDLVAKNKRATINQTTQFNIVDEEAFGLFTQDMITKPQFTWRLASDNLKVNAAKFPQAKGLRFRKDVTIKGINSFNGNVLLKDFSLPGVDPAGGLKFSTTTQMTNESPFTVDLGTVVFDLEYEGVNLGRGTAKNVVIKPGDNDVTLTGRMIPQSSGSDLVKIGKLFTAYLNGEGSPVHARGVSTMQSDGSRISWLSDGITALTLEVPLKAPNTINAIKSITIGYLNLTFTPESAWSPQSSTDELQAKMTLPFGFPMEISQISNSFSIVQNGVNVGSLESPLSTASSDIRVVSSSLTEGSVDITLAPSALRVPSNAHNQFGEFNKGLTQSRQATFQLVGSAKTVATLPIGTITLDPIKFNVTSTLDGLQGLNGYTHINGVDMTGGTSDYLELSIDVNIYNPSSLNLQAGDLTLQLYSGNSLLGTALMPDLHLSRGNNSIRASSQFRANDTPEGTATLTRFLASQDSVLTIRGYDGSTRVESLLPAFKSMNVEATLPGLQGKLLDTAKLTVLPTTGHGNNIAHTQVTLNNPFTSGFTITSVESKVQYRGIQMGTIRQDTTFAAAGKQATTSPNLDLDLNLDPATMFTVLRLLAGEAGLPTEQLDGIVALGGYQYTQPVAKRSLTPRGPYSGFDLPSFVDQAFAVLKADIGLNSRITIGEYRTTMNYAQTGVPIKTDETLHLILPILAQPLVQKIVDGSVMGIDSLIIMDPQETSFVTALKGSITSAGPFDATISFPDGLSVYWNNQQLGKMAMPDVQLVADVGATLDLKAAFAVSNGGQLAAFTKTLIQDDNFEWEIKGENLTVTAMGISVPGISMSKKVSLKGMGGLKGAVTINTFDLPADDPAGGITLTLDTSLVNPSQVGMQVNSLLFKSYTKSGTYLGPVASVPTTNMLPLSTSQIKFAGRMVPQTSSEALADLSKIFTDFIHDISSPVVVQGDGAEPNVSWLSEGVKTIRIDSVLPSRGPMNIIKGITINQMTMDFPAGSAYAPMSSSSDTAASFDLPFGFALNIVQLEQNIVASYQNNKFATLALGTIPATTDVANKIIHLSFQNIPFAVNSGAEGTFQSFLAETTTKNSVTFGLSGTANSQAETAVGRLSISGIAFDVQSVLTGINAFGGTAAISDVKITGSGGNGGNEYVSSPLKTTLNNPSNLSLKAGSITLPTFYQGVQLGESVVPTFDLVPGSNTLAAEFRYHPANANDTVAQSFLQTYLEQGGAVPITIHGDAKSASFDSLVPALQQTSLSSGVPGIAAKMVTHVNVYITAGSLITNEVEVDFDVANPLDTDLQLVHVQSDSGINGETYAHFTWDFPNFVIPAHSSGNSGKVSHVKLVKGVLASLPLASSPTLDLRIAQTGRIGVNGYEIPWLQLVQNAVPVNPTTMAKNIEMSKFIALLQHPSAVSRFKSTYEQCRLRSRTSNFNVTDGELMSVCAYLAGREVAGSAATREACAKLGCITLKSFERVEDAVRAMVNPKPQERALSILSLAEKYQLQGTELEVAQGVAFALKFTIPQALKDDRSPERWIAEEARIHDIEVEELFTMIERMENNHGDQIRSIVDRYQTNARPSRGKSSPTKGVPHHTLNARVPAGFTPKRKAVEQSPTKPTPNKRVKTSSQQAPSITTAPSSQHDTSPVPSSVSVSTTTSGNENEDIASQTAIALDLPAKSPSVDVSSEEEIVVDSLDSMNWETLSHLRQKAIKKQQGASINRNKRFMTVFLDRGFWSRESD